VNAWDVEQNSDNVSLSKVAVLYGALTTDVHRPREVTLRHGLEAYTKRQN